METGFFTLDISSGTRFTKFFQIIFGVICLAVAVIWLVLNISEIKSAGSFWITLLFLAGFGIYQIRAGMGMASRYIEIGEERIRFRRSSFMRSKELRAGDIEKIEFYPLNIIFILRNGKTEIIRFGTTFTEIIEPVRKKTEEFAGLYDITVEKRSEEF